MSDGRYYITDNATGRTFCIEPIHTRSEKATATVFKNGGIGGDAVKNKSQIEGGSILDTESTITEENGFRDIIHFGPHMSPESLVDYVTRNNLRLTDKEVTEAIEAYNHQLE